MLVELSFDSGHYIPQIEHFRQTINVLESKSIVLNDQLKLIYYKNFEKIVSTVGAFKKNTCNMMEQETLLKARGVLEYRGSILFCYNKEQNFYFLPGGTLEMYENLTHCLQRELQEECQLSISVGNFIGCLECHWQESNVKYQELDFIFQIHSQQECIPSFIEGLEGHISFSLLTLESLKAGRHRILPAGVLRFLDAHTSPQYLFENQRLE